MELMKEVVITKARSVNDEAAIIAFESLLGKKNVIVEQSVIGKERANSQGLERSIRAIVYPSSVEEVQQIVDIANSYKLPLYPISKGKNLGYGDKLPVKNESVIVDLSKMN